MTAHELARALLEMPDVPVLLSVDEEVETGIGVFTESVWKEVMSAYRWKDCIKLRETE